MIDRSRERTRNPDVVASRRAKLIVAPFLPKLGQWNLNAASWAAREASHLTTDDERRALRSQRSDLVAEILKEFNRFREAVADEPRHTRIEDVEAAFRRLLRTLDH